MTQGLLLRSSVWSGLTFGVGSGIMVSWYFILLKFNSLTDSGYLLLWVGAAGLLGLLDLGVNTYMISAISRLSSMGKPQLGKKFALEQIWVSTIIFSTFGLLSGWLISVNGWIPGFTPALIIPFLLFILGSQLLLTCTGILKGLQEIRTASVYLLISSIAVYGTSIPLIVTQQPVAIIFSWMGISVGVSSGLLVWQVVHRYLGGWKRAVIVLLCMAPRKCRHLLGHPQVDDKHEEDIRYVSIVGRLKGGLLLFPQLATGIFFNHVLRFVVAQISGVEAVSLVAVSFALASRLHALANSFIEVLYPLAWAASKSGITIRHLYKRIWTIMFPGYLFATITIATLSSIVATGLLKLILIFAAGTWMAILAAPKIHLGNAFGLGGRISLITSAMVPLYVVLSLAMFSSLKSFELWMYPLIYCICQAVITCALPKAVLAHDFQSK